VSARANEICKRRNRELADAPIRQPSVALLASALGHRAAIEQRALSELAKLKPPRAVASAWGRVLAGSQETLAALRKLDKAARANDSKAVAQQLDSSKQVQLELLAAGERAGLRRCSSVG
jgi:hypothetical protein